MQPYGFESVGSYAGKLTTDSKPGRPHTVTTAGDTEISRAAGQRRPKRAARQAARRAIQQALDEGSE